MKFEPLQGRMLIARDPIETHYHGVVLYPDQSRRYASSGLCIAHTPGAYWDYIEEPPMTMRRVHFEKWSGRMIIIQNVEFWVIPETSCLAEELP